MVTISKKINGTYYVALAVPDSAKKMLHIKSAYISNTKKIEADQEFDAKAPNITSKTNLNTTSIDSISRDAKNTTSERKFSFSGVNALNADKSQLAIAQEMELQDKDAEEIRQATGWHRGYDRKWRFVERYSIFTLSFFGARE